MENPEQSFLKDKYWGKEEFRGAVDKSVRKEQRLSEAEGDDFSIPQKPGEQIPHYLERIERITGRVDQKTGERGRMFLERSLYPRYIIKRGNISDDYIKGILLGNFAEQHGYEQGDLKMEDARKHILEQFKKETGQDFESYIIPDDERERVRSMVITDQEARMGSWYDYLTSPEAQHSPAAFRYWAFAEMLKLGNFNEESRSFTKRTETTTASFPELDQQALALVFDEVQRKHTGEPSGFKVDDEARQEEFRKLLSKEDFGKLYAFALEHVNSLRLPSERLIITDGEWRHFPMGSPAGDLTSSLQGFNTKWCIAGEGYAQNYLSRSDLWVYFSKDVDSKNTIPRACIVDSGKAGITEVRGIMSNENAKQHLDSYITPIVEAKLREMPGGEKWNESMQDMKKLARIHLKHIQGEALDKDDLVFIYEIDHTIQSSGYERDPRIEELRSQRNPKEDAPIVLECEPQEIAWSQQKISESTKAYIGPLFKGIFSQHPNIEHIYTSFPEGEARRSRLEIGGKTPEQLEQEMRERNINISDHTRDILHSPDFTTLPEKEEINIVRLRVSDLGFKTGATVQEIYERAEEFGLELCPAETAPHQRLKDINQKMDVWYLIAIKQITDRDGRPLVFYLYHLSDGLWFSDGWADPDSGWSPDSRVAFRFRKVSQET